MIDNFMHTPFNLIPAKHKKNKSRVVYSLSPLQFSFKVETPRSSSQKHKYFHENQSPKRYCTTPCSSGSLKINIKNLIEEEKYQIKVEKVLKKAANFRLSIEGKCQPQKNDSPNRNKTGNDTKDKKFLLEGEHFGMNRIRLRNQRESEKKDQIDESKIQSSSRCQPVMLVGRCKLNSKKRNSLMDSPPLKRHSHSTNQKSETPPLIEGNTQNFDTSQFLMCYHLQSVRDVDKDENSQFSLNSKTIIQYLKSSKIRKYVPVPITQKLGQYIHEEKKRKKCSYQPFCIKNIKGLQSAVKYKDRSGTRVTQSQIENNENVNILKGWDWHQMDQSGFGQMTLPADNFLL